MTTFTNYLEIAQVGLGLSILFIYFCFYTMRKLMARVSWRIGPKYVGPAGILQVLADIFKLMFKEDIVPDIEPRFMRIVYGVAPFILLGLSLSIVAATPLPYEALSTLPVDNGLIWILFLVSLDIVVMIAATWYLSSKYAFLGSYRALAQSLSYDAVLAMSILAPGIASGTTSIAQASHGIHGVWYVFLLPLGFVTALIGVLAELEAIPFDAPEAPTEVVGGWSLEYTGPRFLALFLARRMEGFALMVLLSYLYLGGSSGFSGLPGAFIVMAKAFALAVLVVYIVASYPRYSVKAVLEKAWRLWVPLAYLNLVLAMAYRLLL